MSDKNKDTLFTNDVLEAKLGIGDTHQIPGGKCVFFEFPRQGNAHWLLTPEEARTLGTNLFSLADEAEGITRN